MVTVDLRALPEQGPSYCELRVFLGAVATTVLFGTNEDPRERRWAGTGAGALVRDYKRG